MQLKEQLKMSLKALVSVPGAGTRSVLGRQLGREDVLKENKVKLEAVNTG